jgi:hypothetical protein
MLCGIIIMLGELTRMKIPKRPPTGIWLLVLRYMVCLVIAFALLVLLCAGALGTSVEQALYMTLGQTAQMVIYYPIWAWFLFVVLLVAGTCLWGIIGAALTFYLISSITYKLDVSIIASSGADTADLIFALGYFYRLGILAVAFLFLIVIPTIIWRKTKLNLSVMQGCFCFRFRAKMTRSAQPGASPPSRPLLT